jgi:hypothetical protein
VIVKKDGYVVVNDLQLDLALPADAGANTLQIILCKEGDREEMALRFYGLKITEIDESYRRHVDGLQESLQAKEEEVRRLTQELNETRAAKAVVLEKLQQRQEEIDHEELARRLYRLKSFDAIEEIYRKHVKELQDKYQADAEALTKLEQERDQAKATAEKAAEELAKNKPSQPSVLYQEAERAFLDGKIDRALVLLDDEKLRRSIAQPQAVEKGDVEHAVQSWLLKAQLLTIQLRFDDAERVYLEAIGVAPDSFQTHFAYARFNQELNRFERARAGFIWCLGWARKNEKDAELAQTLNNLGNLDRDQDRGEEARKAFEEALQINRELAQKNPETYRPDLATTLNNLGVLHNEQNRMEEAREAFDEALQIRRELTQKDPETNLPDLAQTLNDLGNLDRNQGRMEEGREEYAEALKIRRELAQKNPGTYRPYVAATLNNLGDLDRAQGRMEEGRKDYAEALQIYEALTKQDPERFSPDVERLKQLLADLPNTKGP